MEKTRATPLFYSQHGEDVVLNELFKGKNTGFFVEVGCIDGRRFSNTLTFEKRGWKGLCVEAHSAYIELLTRNRPNSIVCHSAAGARDDESVIFYANARGSLSTLDPSKEDFFRSHYGRWFTGFEQQSVCLRRLDTLFKTHGITAVDIVSIDIEGSEVDAVRGIDLEIYRPSVFVIESDSKEQESALDEILLPHGYMKLCRVSSNLFYVDERTDLADSLAGKKPIEARLIHTRHPLDSGEDHIVSAAVTFPTLAVPPKADIPVNPTPASSSVLPDTRFRFYDTGFHGDQHLLKLVEFLAFDRQFFIETGTNVGSTLAYFARTYPHIECWSCEPDVEAYRHAVRNARITNTRVFNETSQEFLTRLSKNSSIFKERVLFWLDAHGYGFQWPLRDEIAFITSRFASGYILIDDFRVPDGDAFGFDKYGDQECSFEYIQNSISPATEYNLYYPNYREKTSTFHPLRGWGLITFGTTADLALPLPLQRLIRHAVKGESNKKTALRRALSCRGWTDERKLSLLYDLAEQCRVIEGDILEIGSAWGRSSVLLGLATTKTVWCIDPHTGGLAYIQKNENQDSYREFLENLRKNGVANRVQSLMHTTAEVKASSLIAEDTKFALAFIDGLHTPEGVRIDFDYAFGRLAESGIMIFDDYFEPSVRPYADEIDRLAADHQALLVRDETSRLVYFRKGRDTRQNAATKDHQRSIRSVMNQPEEESAGSVGITDRKIIDRFVANPDNTFLVSFPRTGSHWFRMIMELYFERPSLTRAFYYPDRSDYLSLHTHDIDLDLQRRDVIYLYRDPVDTVYSQLGYYMESPDDTNRIRHWADLYGRHLDKWLWTERITIHKTVLTYEGLKREMVNEFRKVTTHFGQALDPAKLSKASGRISMDEVKRKTLHNQQVMNTTDEYRNKRSEFRNRHARLVWETMLAGRAHLGSWFR